MMYDKSSGYVIAITNKGKVLRELKGEVFLPFDSTYKVRIKNPKNTRVGVEVFIDGTDVTNGKIILNPHETFDLERMILDGDMCSGPSLKFVALDHPDVQDPTDSENGIVTVKFYPETQPITWILNSMDSIKWDGPPEPQYRTFVDDNTSGKNHLYGSHVNISSSLGCNSTQNATFTNQVDAQAGATVGGNDVQQSFTTTTFNCSSFPEATLTLKLRGSKKPVRVRDTKFKHCVECGQKMKRSFKFCPTCGYNMQNTRCFL